MRSFEPKARHELKLEFYIVLSLWLITDGFTRTWSRVIER
jgi:hypothetical protein